MVPTIIVNGKRETLDTSHATAKRLADLLWPRVVQGDGKRLRAKRKHDMRRSHV